MVDLNKDEYVYLMTVRTQGPSKRAFDYNVHPFKTANDVKRAILNVISNNIKNYYRDFITYISYGIGSISDANNYECARIEYKNGVSKSYDIVRRRIEEVK